MENKNEKTRFGKAIDYIIEELNMTKTKIANALANHKNVHIQINNSKISHYIDGTQSPNDEVIQAMYELFHINPAYLKGTSDVLLDGAGLVLEEFNKIFTEWKTTTETIYTDSEGKEVKSTFLHVTMKECYYNFLRQVDYAKFLKEEGMKSFDTELEQCKKECNDIEEKKNWEYVLLPKNAFIEIAESEERDRKALMELLDIEKYCSHTTEVKLNVKKSS